MSAPDKVKTCGQAFDVLTCGSTTSSARLRAGLLMSSSDRDTLTIGVPMAQALLAEIEALRVIADPSAKAEALLKQAEAHSSAALRIYGAAVVFLIVGWLFWVMA